MSSKASKMAGSGKNKQEKAVISEINSARNKLDGVLQTLVTRSEDSELIDSDNIKIEPDMLAVDSPPNVSYPKKGSPSKPPRKRRRKDDSSANETNSFHHTYVMKLFDRSVDLAQFNENIPLYPVCRAWMFNQPQKANSSKGRSSSPDLELLGINPLDENREDLKLKDIRWLPPPIPLEDRNKDLRIPSPIPPLKEPLKFYTENESPPNAEFLLEQHLVRWRNIRQKWKDAAIKNEQRYKDSLAIIKAIFER